MRELFEHERLKPAMIRTDRGYVNTLSTLKRVINSDIPPCNKLIVHSIHFRAKTLLKQVQVEGILFMYFRTNN